MAKSLRIKLAHSGEADKKPTIRPGMVLYGEVCYNATHRETMSALTVNLLGNSAVKAPKGRRELTQLFSVQHPILRKEDNPITLEAKEHRFQFHFVVPWTTEYDRTATFQPDPQGLFTETSHKVPPTLSSRSKDQVQITYSLSAVIRRKSSLSYNFTAVANAAEGIELEGIQCIVELPSIAPEPAIQAQREMSPPTVKQSLFRRSSVVTNDAPDSGCTITLEGSPVLVLNRPYDLKANLEYHSPAEWGSSQYQWTLDIKSIEIVAKTHRRFRDGDVLSEEDSFSVPWGSRLVALAPGRSISEQIGVGDYSPEIVPSFKSYSISRSYRLRVKIYSSLRANTKEVASELFPIDLPIEVVRQGDVLLRRTMYVPQDMNGRPIDPPAYEDSPAYE